MVKAIVIYAKPSWYCERCANSSQVLYIDGEKRYCENCVDAETKSKAKYYNQNQEEIDYKE
jgi:exosome complex RNA-binding protein Csl4